jgi:hypothetical protein
MYLFQLIKPTESVWNDIHATYDSTIYKTKEWFDYLKSWKNINSFIVEVRREDRVIGYFVGEKLRKGIFIIGSPFEGIGTAHQGLSMLKQTSSQIRIRIYKELAKWIFKNGYSSFIQIEDWQLSMDDLKESGIKYNGHDGYLIDLHLDEDVLFHNLHQKSCRYSINKALKSGVIIRETNNINKFIDIYYDQLIEVFAKQGLTPTYDKACVKSIVNALYPNQILLLEAVSTEGNIIATGLFPGDDNLAIFWGEASYQVFQKLCPNELLIWEAIKMWKARGTKVFDMCGVRQYKLKFGPVIYTKPRLMFAKYAFLIPLKNFSKRVYYGLRNFLSKFKT